MNIQIITRRKEIESSDGILISDYSSPRALDDYDLNFIDLSCKSIWKNDRDGLHSINISNDLYSISNMVAGIKTSKVVYVYPQNYEYSYLSHNRILKNVVLKDVIEIDNNGRIDFCNCFPNKITSPTIVFEPTTTSIGNSDFEASFRFEDFYEETAITKSNISKKVTTLNWYGNIYLTTLDIVKDKTHFEDFMHCLCENSEEYELPSWVKDYAFYNDAEQKDIVEDCKQRIADLQKIIEDSEMQLETNNHYKSILCSSGDVLVEVVFDILEQILDCDLSEFIDQRKEDFLIKKEKSTFIGEIKGVSTNVKSEYIAQLDIHYQEYLDDLKEEENVYGMLIINPFRNKTIEEREEVHEKQIEVAKRNKSLIVETETLLKIYELFKQDKINTEKCVEVFSNNIGLLTIDAFL